MIGLEAPFAATDKPSESGLKLALISDKAQVGELIGAEHTDSGLITLLFYDAPTLELPVHGTSDWQLVKPIKGCAIVNIADSLQRESGGRLFSPRHRVVQPEGENLSALYLLRPALE